MATTADRIRAAILATPGADQRMPLLVLEALCPTPDVDSYGIASPPPTPWAVAEAAAIAGGALALAGVSLDDAGTMVSNVASDDPDAQCDACEEYDGGCMTYRDDSHHDGHTRVRILCQTCAALGLVEWVNPNESNR